MGIRYYAYAFEAEQTADALVHPRRYLSADPLADAWGFEPGARIGSGLYGQVVPKRDMLYLDKAWDELQDLTRERPGVHPERPSYRMFEGHVNVNAGPPGWEPWVRVLAPEEMSPIAQDLSELCRDLNAESPDESVASLWRCPSSADYVLPYLCKARDFTRGLVEDGRGMVYMIA